jgi:hypothetical protein
VTLVEQIVEAANMGRPYGVSDECGRLLHQLHAETPRGKWAGQLRAIATAWAATNTPVFRKATLWQLQSLTYGYDRQRNAYVRKLKIELESQAVWDINVVSPFIVQILQSGERHFLNEEKWQTYYRSRDNALQPKSERVRRFIAEIKTFGYRALVKKHHPDLGGSTEDMVALNLAQEWLERGG